MSVLTDLKDAIETKISNLISSHNNSSNAHSNILSNVAKTGNYNDLSNKPTVDSSLSTVSTNAVQNKAITNELNNKSNTSHNHNNLYYTENEIDSLISAHNSNNNAHSNILSTVAKTGDYNDLTNKPTIPAVVDNLTSTDTDKPLSAKQGKILKNLIDSLLSIDNISLISNKSILSAYDSETATLTATVTNIISAPAEGVTVSFYKGSTVLGTATTNSNGVATISYSATGEGVLTFTAECEEVTSNNLQITDYIVYDDLTVDKNRYTLTSGNGTFVFSNTGLKVTGTIATDTFWYAPDNFLPSGDYTVEVDYADWGTDQFASDFGLEGIFLGVQPSRRILSIYKKSGNRWVVDNDITMDFVKGKSWKLEITGTSIKTIKVFYDNVLVTTVTDVEQTRKQFFKTYNNRMTEFKNLKIY